MTRVAGFSMVMTSLVAIAQGPIPPTAPSSPSGAASPESSNSDRKNQRQIPIEEIEEIEEAKKMLRDASMRLSKAFAKRKKPMLGVSIHVTDAGVVLHKVLPGSAAELAGLKAGDVLTAIDDQTLLGEDTEELWFRIPRALRRLRSDDPVVIGYLRDGKALQARVSMEAVVSDRMSQGFDDLESRLSFLRWRESKTLSGIELASLNQELGAYFGANEGVLVVNPPKDERLKLKGGDVLLRIGDRSPKSPTDAFRILSSYTAGERLTIEVLRQRQSQTLTVELPASKERERPLHR
jgi:S1-C subfamily serine protease